MMEQKKVDRAGAGAAETSHIAADPAPARRFRQTAARKQEAVLRVLRGEDIELVVRGIDATAADVSGWRDVFLATGASGLKHRPRDVRGEETDRLRARMGEVTMDNELFVEKTAKMETGHPFGRGRSRRLMRRWKQSSRVRSSSMTSTISKPSMINGVI